MGIHGPEQDKAPAFAEHQRKGTPDAAKVAAFGHGHAPVGPVVARRRANGNRKPMKFVSLHHHSTFSYLDGFQLPEAHMRRAAELQMGALALTEHGNVSSHVKLEMAGEATGVKPIYGCEFYCGPVDEEHRQQQKNHLTVLAQDAVGYGNLLRLVSRAWQEGFHYEPTVSGAMLKEHANGLIVLSGCQGSLLFTSLVGGKGIDPADASYERARRVARRFKSVLDGRYFIEVQAFPELASARRANPALARLAGELGIPLVATLDCHYTQPDENEVQQILHNVRGGARKTLEEQAREWGYDVSLCPPISDRALWRKLMATGLTSRQAEEAILNTAMIAEGCNVKLPKLPMLRYPLPQGVADEVTLWREWLREGWAYRGCDRMAPALRARYRARLRYEAELIESKDYVSYFLTVADAVCWAKDHGIMVGPARGSAAASLVCFLLRITEVDPMVHSSLVFERFIDVSRSDLPDIDLDFDSDRRGEVRDYLVAKYGEQQVSNIGTFTQYKSRLALDDVARVHRIPKYEVEAVKELLLERSSGDLRASATIEDTVEQFDNARAVFDRHPELYKAMQLEGNVKGFGVHAAGLVVSNGPITEVCAVYARKGQGEVISLDKYDGERQGLVKMDFLGLSTCAVLAQALEWLGKTPDFLYGLPLNDEQVLDGFRTNDVVGVFQFDGRAMRSVNGALKPDSFKEICDVNALARPGPLHNGAANEYIDIKRGVRRPERLHPMVDAITEPTNFQIVYQEQILRLVREIGNFDWTSAAYIRKIMSRKIGEQEFNRQWDKFREGALKHDGMTEELAKKVWGLCITAGAYAFNQAHCVSYGLLAYWTMWLKIYHPAVFYAASLAKLGDSGATSFAGPGRGAGGRQSGIRTSRHANLLRDAVRHGIVVRPPHPRLSSATWQVYKGGLLAGFTQLEGVAEKTCALILDHREHVGLRNWGELLAIRGIGPKTVERVKAFCSAEDPFDITGMDKVLARAREAASTAGLPVPTHTAAEVPYERGQDTEICWIGVILQRNLRDIFESNRARTGVELRPEEVKSPELNEWCMLAGFDGEEVVTLRVTRFSYPRFREAIWGIKLNHDVVLARGVKPGFRTAREMYISQLWVFDGDTI